MGVEAAQRAAPADGCSLMTLQFKSSRAPEETDTRTQTHDVIFYLFFHVISFL